LNKARQDWHGSDGVDEVRPSESGAKELLIEKAKAPSGPKSTSLAQSQPGAVDVPALKSAVQVLGGGNDTPLPRMDYPSMETLLSHYVGKNDATLEELQWVAHDVSAKDSRFEFGMSEKASAHTAPPKARQKKLHALEKPILQDLIGLIQRPHDRVTLGSTPYEQGCGHVQVGESGAMKMVPDFTISSDAIKKDHKAFNQHMREYNANLASVTAEGSVVTGRSARTDTAVKLEELLVFNAMESLRVSDGDPAKAVGIQAEPESGQLQYSMALSTAMDLSFVKGVVTSILPGGEDEREFIAKMEKSVEELFGESSMITRRVEIGGQEKSIQIQRPLLINMTMSGQSGSKRNIQGHRSFNQASMERLGAKLCAQLKAGTPAQQVVANGLEKILGGETAGRPELWKKPSFISLQTELSPKEQLALKALELTMTGSVGDEKLEGDRDPGREYLLVGHLLDVTNTAVTAQCKSGEDRTLTLVSLKVAQNAFERQTGRPYDPMSSSDNTDTVLMRELFTDAANALGENMVKIVRGFDSGKAKWKSHNVPRDWYNQNQNPSHPIGDFSWK